MKRKSRGLLHVFVVVIAIVLVVGVHATQASDTPASEVQTNETQAHETQANETQANETQANEITAKSPSLTPLPNPLSLEQALALADEMYPDIALAQAELEDARAQLLHAQSNSGLRSYIDITAESKKLTTNGEFTNDSIARFVVSKPIYDFGRSSALEESRSAFISSREYSLFDVRLRHRYEIMRLFYSVLLADSRYMVDNEEMTQRFLKFDKKRERQSLGMVSDVEVLEAENFYLEALDLRTASEKLQRTSRLLLAIALNQPNDLPADLIQPKRIQHDKKIPDEKMVYEAALMANQTILAIKQQIESARAKLQAERARYYPNISAEFELADYQQESSTRGDVRASVNFRIPIYQGNENKAAVARASAALASGAAQLRKAEHALLINVQELIQQLEILNVKRKTALQRELFRELSLDKRRALYEMEVQTNMSDALVRTTEALWLSKKIEFDIALTWAQINVLLAKPLINNNEVTISNEVIAP
ncbi:MAG: TolC family protein [Gammaproteobacteria bacterium]|nr:TolC family protein [Gammaproteobacteria bacterium]